VIVDHTVHNIVGCLEKRRMRGMELPRLIVINDVSVEGK
jgi:hypothetical protein